MKPQIAEFINLIDPAIAMAEQMSVKQPSERLNNVIGRLQSIKNQALGGQLESSQGVSTLGLAREVADWIEPLDSPLLKAVGTIEEYYQKYL